MEELLIEGEGLNQQGGSVWIWRGGGFSAVTITLEIHLEGKRHQKLYIKRLVDIHKPFKYFKHCRFSCRQHFLREDGLVVTGSDIVDYAKTDHLCCLTLNTF